jgi:hypothetical protein
MKPKAYGIKYAHKPWNDTTQNDFHQDFCVDFQTVLELALGTKDQLSLSAFDALVRQSKEKFSSIRFQLPLIPLNYWDMFTHDVIHPTRKSVCAKELAEERAQRARQRAWEENMARQVNSFREAAAAHAYQAFFFSLFASMRASPVPTEEFTLLGITPVKDVESIKAAFRTAAKAHHPDAGGNAADFNRLTEAKNKCLAYASN